MNRLSPYITVYGWLQNAGDIDIDVRGAAVTTAGADSYGIYGKHQGAGDIDIDVHNLTITTESTEVSNRGLTSAHGIVGYHSNQDGGNTGDIFIDAHAGADITTKGAFSYGLYGLHQGAGNNIHIATDADSSITTTGASGHGIVAYHFGTEDTRSIDITVGGDITAGGTNAQGVRVGAVSSGQAARAAAFNEDGYRRQTVTVNGSVTSNAEGVFLAGGGRVVIGPQGSITSASGIAILATGDTPGADPQNDPPIPPKLRVDMNLDGRRVSQAIGDDWIINDGGETHHRDERGGAARRGNGSHRRGSPQRGVERKDEGGRRQGRRPHDRPVELGRERTGRRRRRRPGFLGGGLQREEEDLSTGTGRNAPELQEAPAPTAVYVSDGTSGHAPELYATPAPELS